MNLKQSLPVPASFSAKQLINGINKFLGLLSVAFSVLHFCLCVTRKQQFVSLRESLSPLLWILTWRSLFLSRIHTLFVCMWFRLGRWSFMCSFFLCRLRNTNHSGSIHANTLTECYCSSKAAFILMPLILEIHSLIVVFDKPHGHWMWQISFCDQSRMPDRNFYLVTCVHQPCPSIEY